MAICVRLRALLATRLACGLAAAGPGPVFLALGSALALSPVTAQAQTPDEQTPGRAQVSPSSAGGLPRASRSGDAFSQLPPVLPAEGGHSQAQTAHDYRDDAARHLYGAYPTRIHRGRLPPMLHGVAVVETDVDEQGQVLAVRLRRPPAAAAVGPWIERMIRRAAPFPVPARLGPTTYTDIWLVHKDGQFQLDTLTEGQD